MKKFIIVISILVIAAVVWADVKLFIYVVDSDTPYWVSAAYWWLMGSLMTLAYRYIKKVIVAYKAIKAANKMFANMGEQLRKENMSQYDDLYKEDKKD